MMHDAFSHCLVFPLFGTGATSKLQPIANFNMKPRRISFPCTSFTLIRMARHLFHILRTSYKITSRFARVTRAEHDRRGEQLGLR